MMFTEILLASVVKQLLVAVPAIILGTQTLTAAINGAFNIEKGSVKHAISWVIAVLAGLGFVAFNGLVFVAEPMWLNYVLGGVSGLFAGAAANGFYDWEPIHNIFKLISELFGGEKK